MAFPSYRIGVHLAMTNNVSQALGLIAGQLFGMQRQLQTVSLGFNTLTTAIAGAGAAWAGAGLVAGTAALVRHGSELVHQQTLLKAANEDSANVARATQAAWAATMQVQGTTVGGNLRVLGELRGLLGSLGEAEQVMPDFQRLSRVLSIVTGQRDEAAGGQIARAMDIRGAIRYDEAGRLDRERFQAEMDAITRTTVQNRGRLSPRELLNFVQQAGPAGIMLSPQAMYADMSVLIESMGGHRAGTALQAAARQMLSGIMPVRNADLLRAAGLIEGPYQEVKPRDRARIATEIARENQVWEEQFQTRITPAQHVQLGQRAIRGRELLQTGQWQEYFVQYLKPAMDRWMQRSEGRDATRDDQLRLIAQWFSTGPGQRFWSQIALSQQQIERERETQRRIDPAAALRTLESESPVAAWQNLTTAWSNLMTAMGAPATADAVTLMNKLADGIKSLTDVVSRHPDAARTLVAIAAALGAVLVVAGAVAVIGAGIAAIGGGTVAAAILAISGAIAGLAYVATRIDWPALGARMRETFNRMTEWFVETVQGFVRDAEAAWTWVTAVIVGWAESITTTVQNFVTAATLAWNSVVATISGWATALWAAVERFRIAAVEAFQAIVDWITGLPRRIIDGLTNRGTAQPLGNPMGDQGALGGASPSNFVPSAIQREQIIQTRVDLDGRTIADVISRHQGRAAQAPTNAAPRYDRYMAPLLPDGMATA